MTENNGHFKRIAFFANFLFGCLVFDIILSHSFFIGLLDILGWLRRTTNGGISVHLSDNEILNQLLALISMFVITLFLTVLYIVRPNSLKNFVTYPYKQIKKIVKLFKSIQNLAGFIDILLKSIVNLLSALFVLYIILFIPAIILNFISLLAIFLKALMSLTVYKTLVFSLFLINSFLSYRLLMIDSKHKTEK